MARSKSVILAYHSISKKESVITIPPEVFQQQMEWLAGSGTHVAPLGSVREAPGSVALTFDDGYRDFLEEALPVLVRFRLPATVFVVAGRCGGKNDWDQAGYRSIPTLELMNWEEVRQAARSGVEIGAHTYSHPDLRRLGEADVAEEFARCQEEIAARTGQPARSLAYPYGYSNAAVRAIARRFFDCACGTRLDYVRDGADRFDLPRVDMYYFRNLKRFRELIVGDEMYLNVRRALRSFRQFVAG